MKYVAAILAIVAVASGLVIWFLVAAIATWELDWDMDSDED